MADPFGVEKLRADKEKKEGYKNRSEAERQWLLEYDKRNPGANESMADKLATMQRNAERKASQMPGTQEFRDEGREARSFGRGERDFYSQAGRQNIGELQKMQRGEGSVAMEQARQLSAQAAGRGFGMAQGAGPAQRGLATRAAMQSATQQQMNATGQGMIGSLGERAMATNALGSMIGQGASGGLANQQMGFGMQSGTEQFNVQSQQQAQAMIDARDAERRQREAAAQQAMLGAFAQGGAAMVTASGNPASDKRVKSNIEDGGRSVDKFMDNLKAYTFNYKNPGAPGQTPGTKTGVMAQDLEKSVLGGKMVEEQDGVKHIDLEKMVPTLAASIARLNERLDQNDKKKSKKG